MTRRMSSRKVALSAAFLALAAGGTAACDSSSTYDDDDTYETVYQDSSDDSDDADADADQEQVSASGDEVFYCADENGEIVDEDQCDTADGGSSFFLWHSTGYTRGLRPGTTLNGGDFFPANDRKTRKAFKLPAAGKVGNGTVKTNIVGRSSGGSSGTSNGGSGVSSGGSSGTGLGGSSGG